MGEAKWKGRKRATIRGRKEGERGKKAERKRRIKRRERRDMEREYEEKK